jgi:transketolase N-terminal domain/subunit
MFAPAQILRNWCEQRPSNQGDLDKSHGVCWESLLHGVHYRIGMDQRTYLVEDNDDKQNDDTEIINRTCILHHAFRISNNT